MAETLLAIDDISWPLRRRTCLYLNRPTVRPEPVLSPSAPDTPAPDNLAAHFYGTVLRDGGRYRMWYYACHRGLNPDWPPRQMQQLARQPAWLRGAANGDEVYQGPLCYAESEDGLVWVKPNLAQVRFKGSYDNNALALPHTLVSGAAVIRDDADPDPSRRYKMVYQYFPDQTEPPIAAFGNLPSVATAVSSDGLAWRVLGLPYVNQFVEHCSLIRHGGRYILHSQVFPGTGWSGVCTEGGGRGGRSGIAHWTYDFDRWPDLWQWSLALPEPETSAGRGSGVDGSAGAVSPRQVHLGVGAASFGNVCVGLYGLWHDRADFGAIQADLGLVVSNDGVRFREPGAAAGQAFIHRDDSPAVAVAGRCFNTILCQGNGILNVGQETRIYHGRWRNVGQQAADIAAYYRADVALATLPRDRWGALGLNPDSDAGAVCSVPLAVHGRDQELVINGDGVAGLTVELLDERMVPVPDGAGGVVVGGDGLDNPVRWRQRGFAEVAAGRPLVRLQLRLERGGGSQPRVYAAYLRRVHGRESTP